MKTITAILLVLAGLLPPIGVTQVDAWYGSQQCTKYEAAMAAHAPRGGWDVNRMSYYSYRESRCTPTVVSRTNDHGLLQVNRINFPYLSSKFGVPVSQMATWLKDPTNNIRAAAKLCEFWRRAGRSCYRPWATG